LKVIDPAVVPEKPSRQSNAVDLGGALVERGCRLERASFVPATNRRFDCPQRNGTAHRPGASLSRILQWSIPKRTRHCAVGAVLPVMFYPRVFEGDTHLGSVMALVALFTFRTEQFANRRDVPWRCCRCCVSRFTRSGARRFGLARTAYTYLTFLVLWTVCQRDRGGYLSAGVS